MTPIVASPADPQQSASLLDQAARSLEALGARPEFHQRTIPLQSLARALKSADSFELATWEAVDLHAAFPEDAISAAAADSGRNRRLGRIALIACFLPLLTTWVGLKSAASGYHELVQANGRVPNEPFFALWQSGFGGRSMTFGTVALLTILALLIFVGAQIAARVRTERSEAESIANYESAAADLAKGLILARRAIAGHRESLPKDINAEIVESARLLRQATDETRRVLTTLQSASTKADKALHDHLNLVQNSQSTIETATSGILKASGELEKADVSSISPAIVALTNVVTAVGTNTAAMGTGVSKAITAHDDAAAQRFKAATDNAARAHTTLNQLLDGRVRAIEAAFKAFAISEGQRTAKSFQDLLGAIGSLASETDKTLAIHVSAAGAGEAQVRVMEELIAKAEELMGAIQSMSAPAPADPADTVVILRSDGATAGMP